MKTISFLQPFIDYVVILISLKAKLPYFLFVFQIFVNGFNDFFPFLKLQPFIDHVLILISLKEKLLFSPLFFFNYL